METMENNGMENNQDEVKDHLKLEFEGAFLREPILRRRTLSNVP